jgi:hypothetical protein
MFIKFLDASAAGHDGPAKNHTYKRTELMPSFYRQAMEKHGALIDAMVRQAHHGPERRDITDQI